MNVVLQSDDRALLSLSSDELLAITNALNEICNGVHIADNAFQTRLGVSREFMSGLQQALLAQPHPSRFNTETVDAWSDQGAVMVRVINVFGDPVELGEVAAAAFAGQLSQSIERAR